MMPFERYILLLFCALLVFCDQDLQLRHPTSTESLPTNGTAYYKFTVPSNMVAKSVHLIFDVSSAGEDLSDPDLFISSTTPHPNGTQNEWKCTAYGQDVCIVPKEKVAPAKQFYVTVYCQRKCQYKLIVRTTDEKELLDGEGQFGELKASESQIFRFFVPSDSAINSIGVSLSLGTTNTSMVRMFISKANNELAVPSSQSPIRGIPSWLGLATRVYSSDKSVFCRNCTYKVLVTTSVETSYSITYKTSQGITKVKGERLDTYDLVKRGEKNCYEYNVRDEKTTLQINLNTYSGNPDIYVNPESIPRKLEEFALSSRGGLDEILTVTPGQRHAMNTPTGNYYICIYGRYHASYNLMIYTEDEEHRGHIPIISGLTRTMEVKTNELKTFEYHMTNYNVPANITIFLASITGNADLYIKYCATTINADGSEATPCTFTKEDMNDTKTLKSIQTSSVDSISLRFNPKDCVGNNMKCGYVIGVYGVVESKFSLSVLEKEQLEVPLAEGVPVFGHVGLYQFAHYTFNVEDPETSTVKIQLTSMSGDADLYLSRVNPYCGCILAERGSTLENFLPDTLMFYKERDGKLNTNYHISVYGFTDATFSLYYTTSSPNQTLQAVRLYDGQPQNGVINGTGSGRESALYKFTVGFPESDLRDIRVILTPFSGKYQVYIGADYIPTPQNYTWEMSEGDTQIHIPNSDLNYRKRATYNVLVQKFYGPSDEFPHAFNIKYVTGAFLTTLLEGYPEIGNLTLGQYVYYKYHVVNLTGSITVTVTPFSGDPDLYISIRDSNKMPNMTNHDYVSAALGADSITIKDHEFQEKNPACALSAYSTSLCAIYIGVTCASDQCSFSLQVTQKEVSTLKLIDGIPQYGTVTPLKPLYYIVTPSEDSNTVISVYPTKGSVRVYANIMPISSYIHNPAQVLPSPTKHNMSSSLWANAETLVIRPSAVKRYGRRCQVYVGVYYENVANENPRTEISEYTIVASSSIIHLADGVSVVDEVLEKSYRYYYFVVPCADCVLSISLTALSEGDPDLYVNKGRNRLPGKENADFNAATYRGDFLQITGKEQYFVDRNEMSVQGRYTIAVYGFQNCTYTLTATTSASAVQQLSIGIPTRQEAKQGHISYFMFHSWKHENIQASLSIHSGRAAIRANVVKDLREADILRYLPATEQKSTWSSVRSNTVNSLVISKDDANFLDGGVYFFAVEALDACSYDITVEYTNELSYTFIRLSEPYRIHLAKDEVKRVAFMVSSKSKVTISLYTIYGLAEGKVATGSDKKPSWTLTSSGLVIEPTDPEFQLGTYYLTFTATTEAEFTVTIVNSPRNMFKMLEGLPAISALKPGVPSHFYYAVPAYKLLPDSEGQFSVFVKFMDPVMNPTIYLRKIAKNDSAMPNEHLYDVKIVYDQDTGQLGATIPLKYVSFGPIAISVTGETYDNKDARFAITTWTTGVVLMVPEHQYTRELATTNDMHVYEISVQSAGKLFVEVVPCMGEVEFLITKSLTNLNDRKYDLKKTELSKGKLFGSIDAPAGTYYVAVREVGMESPQKVRYMIRTIIKDAKAVDELEDYYMEKYGNIEYFITDKDGKVSLQWGRLLKRTNDINEAVNVQYKIYVAEKGKANMHTVCGIVLGNTKKVAETTETSYEYSLDKKMRDKTLVFNVIAKVRGQDQTFAYNPVVLQLQRPPRIPRAFVAILIVTILALALAAIYYCRRYKKIQERLEYEMNDARNLARVSTEMEVPVSKMDTYAHLRSDNQS